MLFIVVIYIASSKCLLKLMVQLIKWHHHSVVSICSAALCSLACLRSDNRCVLNVVILAWSSVSTIQLVTVHQVICHIEWKAYLE